MKPTVNIPTDWQNLIAKLERKQPVDTSKPAWTYSDFLTAALQTFIEKSTDYDDRYLRALIQLDARTIWTWEVEKKLDRLRSWIKRGELQVKGEGIRNSVDDLYIYTVQYVAYIQNVVNNKQDPDRFLTHVRNDRAGFFWHFSRKLQVEEWIEFLEDRDLIKKDEILLKLLLRSYMGDQIKVEEWKGAIKQVLAR